MQIDAIESSKYFAVILVVIIVGFIALTFVATFGGIYLFNRSKRGKMQALMAVGKQGEATILQMEDTGMRINDDPRVRFVLSVRIPGHPEYQVTKTMVMPMIRMPQVQPGSVVAVMADPTQPANPDMVGLLLR